MSNEQLTLGSLFDGSGGFLLGGVLAGIKPVWKSEIALPCVYFVLAGIVWANEKEKTG